LLEILSELTEAEKTARQKAKQAERQRKYRKKLKAG